MQAYDIGSASKNDLWIHEAVSSAHSFQFPGIGRGKGVQFVDVAVVERSSF